MDLKQRSKKLGETSRCSLMRGVYYGVEVHFILPKMTDGTYLIISSEGKPRLHQVQQYVIDTLEDVRLATPHFTFEVLPAMDDKLRSVQLGG